MNDHVTTTAEYVAINITTTDPRVRAFITGMADAEAVTSIRSAISIGIMCIGASQDRHAVGALQDSLSDATKTSAAATKRFSDTVRETASTVKTQINETLEAAFGKNGKDGIFGRSMAGQLAKLQDDLARKFDANYADSYVAQFAKTMAMANKQVIDTVTAPIALEIAQQRDMLHQLMTRLDVKDAVDVAEAKGTAKGTDFERGFLEDILTRIALPKRDAVEYVGTTAGSKGPRSKVGDFTYTLDPRMGGIGLRIAIEAKNSQDSLTKLTGQVRDAIDNREAVVGVGVSTNPRLLPADAAPICFVADQIVIANVPDYAAQPAIATLTITIAIEVARVMALAQRQGAQVPFDALAANERIVTMRSRLRKLSEAKRRLTAIDSITTDVKGLLTEIAEALTGDLEGLREDLGIGDVSEPDGHKLAS